MIKIKFIFIITLLINLNGSIAKDEKSDIGYQLENLAVSMLNKQLSESDYKITLEKAANYSVQLFKLDKNPYEPYGGLLKRPVHTILELGPALGSFSDYYLSYVNSSQKRVEAYVGLAMIQDERGVLPIISQIVNSHHSESLRSHYIALLGLYGKKVKHHLPYLNYFHENEWSPDVKDMILRVKELILSDRARDPWERYKTYKELKGAIQNFCGKSMSPDYIHFPEPENSNTNQLKELSNEELIFLASIGQSVDDISLVWKNRGLFKFLLKKSGRKGELILIDDNLNVFEVDGGQFKSINDLFTVGDRVFLVTLLSHNGNGKRHIEEIIWDKNKKIYKIDQSRFSLGANYKGLSNEDSYYLLDGLNWSYKINKKTGVIVSGLVCDEQVNINYAL